MSLSTALRVLGTVVLATAQANARQEQQRQNNERRNEAVFALTTRIQAIRQACRDAGVFSSTHYNSFVADKLSSAQSYLTRFEMDPSNMWLLNAAAADIDIAERNCRLFLNVSV